MAKDKGKKKKNKVTKDDGTKVDIDQIPGADTGPVDPKVEKALKRAAKKKSLLIGSGSMGVSSETAEVVEEHPEVGGLTLAGDDATSAAMEEILTEEPKKKKGKKGKKDLVAAETPAPAKETAPAATRTRRPKYLPEFEALRDRANSKGKKQSMVLPTEYKTASYGETIISKFREAPYDMNISAISTENDETGLFSVKVTVDPDA